MKHPGPPPGERREKMPIRESLPTAILRQERDGSRVAETVADLARLDRDRSLLHLIAMVMRPGAMYFCTYLEYAFFPPGTAANDLYQHRIVQWEGMWFQVSSIPIGDRPKAFQAANRAELDIKDGVPTAITKEGMAFFPLKGPNSFHMVSRAGAPLYRGQTSVKSALATEEEECDEIVEVFKRTGKFP